MGESSSSLLTSGTEIFLLLAIAVLCCLLGCKGQGGVGKTMLAAAAVNDEQVRRRFSRGGLQWLAANESAKAEPLLRQAAQNLHAWLGSRYGERAPPSPSLDEQGLIAWIARVAQ